MKARLSGSSEGNSCSCVREKDQGVGVWVCERVVYGFRRACVCVCVCVKEGLGKLGDSPANSLINQGVMATLQERRLGYNSQAGLEPGNSRFSTLRLNYYAARGIGFRCVCVCVFAWVCVCVRVCV
jgi:hypothetical protein